MRKYHVAGLIGLAVADSIGAGMMATSSPASAQMNVYDPANYAQNLLTAARTLTQISNQIQSLQNEAQMLANMGRNLSRIDFPQFRQLQQRLGQIDRLMGQAQGIDFRVGQLDDQFRQLYPENLDQLLRRDQRTASARARLAAAMSAFRQTMGVQSQIVANVRDDAQALAEIVARSQDAEGSLQVSQATNQLLALTAKQQLQIQNLMASQFRAQAIEQAERAQIERESRESVRRFLGDGHAYTPRPRQ
ncbi:P-type conjugative transfer protein TrbJ [Sphingosinicella sp. LHD-64]|uniref:P-type conjugative transfer protein TrbJ n=1 Tax=Sphingosinicella sp. LHD-64 TaxID=3072139 RepID=UPI00280E906B|nr:P-type conjugative transfer protein TrbJ [Sphingosinicella sp. LHD-64]MDQ8757483.1 P-type conjugative transfer protein TrbJ [Sphingosinicella sp. LHD-64]